LLLDSSVGDAELVDASVVDAYAADSAKGDADRPDGSLRDAGVTYPPRDDAGSRWEAVPSFSVNLPAGYNGQFNRRYWGNLVWDPDAQRILFAEGYGGDRGQLPAGSIYANAIYSFNTASATVTFHNLSEGWRNTAYNQYVKDPAQPPAPHPRHTYGGFAYVPSKKSVYVLAGACLKSDACPGNQVQNAVDFWVYDFPRNQWRAITSPLPDGAIGGFDLVLSHLDGASELWAFSPDRSGSTFINIYVFNLDTETWSQAVPPGGSGRPSAIEYAVADPVRRSFLLWAKNGDGKSKLFRFDRLARVLTEIASSPSDLGVGTMAYDVRDDHVLLYEPTKKLMRVYKPSSDTWSEIRAPGDPGERVDDYFVYDPVNDAFVTYTGAPQFWLFLYRP
jgi:hypothetical protein